MNSNKLISCQYKYPWLFILLLQISVFSLIGYSCTGTYWARSQGMSFGLLEITYQSKSYNIVLDYESTCSDSDNNICDKIVSLRRSLIITLVGLATTLVFSVFWIFTSISFLFEINFYRTGRILGNLVPLSFALSITYWIVSENVWLCNCRYKNTCTEVCFENGFIANLVALFLMCFTQFFYYLIGVLSIKLSEIGFRNLKALEKVVSHRRNNSGYPSTEISRIVY